jgi:hypothetical protein
MYPVTHNKTTVTFANLDDLIAFRNELNRIIDSQALRATDRQPNELINNAAAVRIAAGRGIPIRTSTLVAACDTGRIPGASKPNGRWIYSLLSFEKWLAAYTPKTGRS